MLGILSCTLGFLSVDQRSSPPSAVLGGWAALLLCATHLLLGIVSRLRRRRAVFLVYCLGSFPVCVYAVQYLIWAFMVAELVFTSAASLGRHCVFLTDADRCYYVV